MASLNKFLTLPPCTLIDFVQPNFSRSWPFNRVDRVKEYLGVEWNEYINPLSRNVRIPAIQEVSGLPTVCWVFPRCSAQNGILHLYSYDTHCLGRVI